MNLLICAAWEPELTHFRALASDVAVEGVGVGLVDAAAGTARAVARHGPDGVLLLGTCGAFPGHGLAIGDVVVARAVAVVDVSLLRRHAALPPPMLARVTPDASWVARAEAEGARSVQIANTVGVTTDDALASELAKGADVEHLEAFAFARAIPEGVPYAIVLGVANMVGSTGRDEWRQHQVEASRRAAEIGARFVRTTRAAQSPAKA